VKVKKEKYDPGYERVERMNARQKRSHSPDDRNDRRKSAKYGRDESEGTGAQRDRHREYEGERNRETNFRDGTRDRERNYRDESDKGRHRMRDYGDDDRGGGRYRETEEIYYDKRSDKDRRDRGSDKYDRGSDKYDRGSDRYDSGNDRYSRQDDRKHYDRDYSDRGRNRDSRR
jgi:hypothetical protein